MKRIYVVGSALLVVGFAFGAIAAERESSKEQRRAENAARITAEQRDQQAMWQRDVFPYAPVTPTAAATRQEQDVEDETTAALRDDKLKVAASLTMALDDADRRINDLEATARGATADRRTDFDRVLNDVSIRRDALRADRKAIDVATDDTWEGVRARIELDTNALERSLRLAASHINGARPQAMR